MNAPSDTPLTYPAWLSSHTDEDIAHLLFRLHSEGSQSLTSEASAPLSDPALHQLTALELAVLHAAVEIGAGGFGSAATPVGLTELEETLTELFDIAGTTAENRPSTEEVTAAIASLARWGLAFSSELDLQSTSVPADAQVQIPAHLPPLFEPSTEELWRLADCHRCPIPTADLLEVISELPPRQRRLLGTLSRAGGVGHSASLRPDADPSAPLPTLVSLGVLDQLDESTARLSGRIAAHLKGGFIAPAGGTFPFIAPADALRAHHEFEASERQDATGAATAVQHIQALTALIAEVGATPIQPLTSGGIGTRELGKLSRRTGQSIEEITELVTSLYTSNFLAREFPEPTPDEDTGQTYWAITEQALDFVEAPLSTQWAMLLLGWAGSTYQSWMSRDPEVRPLEPSSHAHSAAEMRRFFPATVTAPDPEQRLWALRPALAAETTHVAFNQLLNEAHLLGMTVPAGTTSTASNHAPTSAAAALGEVLSQWHAALADGHAMSAREATSALAERLEEILPAPVDMLIVQGDHTIMAPGLLASDDHHMLAHMATAESTGMASVWRVTKESVMLALTSGETVASLTDFLDRMAPGGIDSVPQSLRYLFSDAERALSQGRSQLPANDSKTRVPSRVPTPRRHELDPSVDTDPDTSRQLEDTLEGFRRALATADIDIDSTESNASTTSVDTRTVRTSREIMSELRRAYSAGTRVRLHYVDYAGARAQDWISIIMMSASTISAVIEDSGESLTVQPHRVAAVEVPV